MYFDFNYGDYLIIAILGLSAMVSIFRGFVKEALSVVSWIVAFTLSSYYADNVASYLVKYVDSNTVAMTLGFALIFFITMLVMSIINFFLSHILKHAALGFLDVVFGVVFGLIRGFLIICIIVLVMDHLFVTHFGWWHDSWLLQQLMPWIHKTNQVLLDQMLT